MTWYIKYWNHVQTGQITNAGASASTVIPFCTNFTGIPRVVHDYANCEGGTSCHSNVTTASFTLHTGLAGTVDWIAILSTECYPTPSP